MGDFEAKSAPISRVGSYQLLYNENILSNQGTAQRDSNVFASSSINISQSDKSVKNQEQEASNNSEIYGKINILESVTTFENLFDDLVMNITTFREKYVESSLERLIEQKSTIDSELKKLKEHHKLGDVISKLNKDKSDLQEFQKNILKKLIAYRSELLILPKIPTRNTDVSKSKDTYDIQSSSVDVEETLRYAMKLAKFTRAPPLVGNLQFQIHPNNYIWPAEDALRRGTLAESSLKSTEIIEAELGRGSYTENDVSKTEMLPQADEKEDPIISKANIHKQTASERSPSHKSHISSDSNENSKIELDFFDPDDDFSD